MSRIPLRNYSSYIRLARAVYTRDIKQGALGSSLSALFFGKLRISVEAAESDDTYTYLRKPGWAVIHIGLWTGLRAAGFKRTDPVDANRVMKDAKAIKTALEALSYHEIGHLLESDMSGEEFDKIPQKYLPFSNFIKIGSNAIEDPAMESIVKKNPYRKFMGKYFRWLTNRMFFEEARKYRDTNDEQGFLYYILLYLRVGPKILTRKNAMFESLRPKGIVRKLRDAFKEKDAKLRCRKEISFLIWCIDELGLQPSTANKVKGYARPIILIVGKSGNSMPLPPENSGKSNGKTELPPVSVAVAGGAAGGGGETPDADIIDLRQDKDDPDDAGEGNDQQKNPSAESEDGSANEGEEGEERAQSSESQSSQKQEGDLTASGSGDSEAPIGEEEAFDWEIGDDDPIEVLGSERLDEAVDEDLANALETDALVDNDQQVVCIARDSYTVKNLEPREQYRKFSAKISHLTGSFVTALEKLREESASRTLRNLSDGEDICVEDYIEAVRSGEPPLEIYTQETRGAEITDLAVSLLVDCSGSMSDKTQFTYAASCLIATACEEAKVPTDISVFSSGGSLVLKSFDEDTEDCIDRLGMIYHPLQYAYQLESPSPVSLWGSTDCPSALALTLGRMRKYDEKAYKLVFIITDGDTGGPEVVGKMVSQAREEGIVVIGIGIGTSYSNLKKCFGHCRCFDATSLGQLPAYIAKEIEDAMSSDNLLGF